MLTAKNRNAQQAIDYFSQGYYDTSLTRWYGKGAAALGLSGRIQNKEVFANICNGLNPDGTKQLGRDRSRAAIDCTFSAPKSVSLTALIGGDERLEAAHRKAVEKTLSIMEQRYAQTRVRMGTCHPKIRTDNLVVAQFDHIESRELDPHLHTHALVMNLTQTEKGAENSSWYSLWNEEIYTNKKHLGMIYQSYLAAEVQKLGYEIEARSHGQFEIKGYKQDDLIEFSKRRQQIIAEVGADASWVTRENAWSITRKAKQHLPAQELRQAWKEEALALGIVPVLPETTTSLNYYEARPSLNIEHLNDAIAHCCERSVEFSVEDLEKFILNQRLAGDIGELALLVKENPYLLKVSDSSFTTLSALKRENDTIALMKSGQEAVMAIATTESVNNLLNQSTLNLGQSQAVRLAATTTDRFVAWQGVAGAGKTFALGQLKAIAAENGYKIQGLAPSAEAAKVLGTELGIEANTVARKLVTAPPQDLPTNQIWVIDEAGLLGAKDALDLLQRAESENARIVMVGDTKQLSSVAAGNPFKSLQEAGMQTALMNESLRQRTPQLKTAIDLLASGMVVEGFQKLEENGSMVELATEGIVSHIADEYILIPKEQRAKTLVLAGTNDKRREITQAIRSKLQMEGTIGIDTSAVQLQSKNLTTIEMKYTHNFEIGDVVVPIRDYKRRGLVKGEQYSVRAKNGDHLVLSSQSGEQFEVDTVFEKALYQQQAIDIAVGDRLKWTKNDHTLGRRNGQEFSLEAIEWDKATIKYEDGRTEIIDLQKAQHLDHALVVTTYASQGKTCDRVLWAADFTASTENFYVATSRAKYDLKIFTDNKAKLLEKALVSKTQSNPRDLLRRQILWEQEREKVSAKTVAVATKHKTRPDAREKREDYSANQTRPQQRDELQLQANIQSFLQLSDKDLLIMDRFLKDYFQGEESKLDTQNTRDKKALLEALRSPQVQEQVTAASIELNRIQQEQEEKRVQNLQLRKGLAF